MTIASRLCLEALKKLQACFAQLGYQAGDCPVAERAATSVLSLPIYSELNSDQLAYVVETVNAFFEH